MTSSESVIELLDFALFGVSVVVPEQRAAGFSTDGSLSIDFSPRSVKAAPDDLHLYLTVSFEAAFRDGKPLGPTGSARIAGHFRAPREIPEDKRQWLLLYNGAIILYGLLRGQIAGLTGSMPTGKFMLPSVNMQHTVREWAERRAGVAQKAVIPGSIKEGARKPPSPTQVAGPPAKRRRG